MKTLGFPRMHKEKNERRDFTPNFFKALRDENVEIYLEYGYGSCLGFKEEDYIKANPNIKFTTNKECYKKDIVVVLRAPEFYELDYMKQGSILISMLHYPTRPTRVKRLKEKGIYSISLDSIRNDFLERMVVNYKGTAFYGMEVAFRELEKAMKSFYSKDREPINVAIMGMGMVGLYAAKAAGHFGYVKEIEDKINNIGAKGVLVEMIPRNITEDEKELIKVLKRCDILVDATTRSDPTKYIIKNELIGYMKSHAIILDLTADPYLTDTNPIQVKAIEGIPTGSLDKFVFYPDDEEYDKIPKEVNTKNRRIVVSCNAWPGVKPLECMELYGIQVLPILKKVINLDIKDFTIDSPDFIIRAIYRGTIEYYEKERCV